MFNHHIMVKLYGMSKMFPIYDYVEKETETDLLIMLGATFPDTDILKFKANDKRKKVIKYICGNNYFNDSHYLLCLKDHPKLDTIKN